MGRNLLVSRWYRDEACNSCKCAMAVMVEGLTEVLFEPIESVSEKFLLTITSLKRVGDLKALSVAPSCLKFAFGMVKAFLHPKIVYVPKVPTNVACSIVL